MLRGTNRDWKRIDRLWTRTCINSTVDGGGKKSTDQGRNSNLGRKKKRRGVKKRIFRLYRFEISILLPSLCLQFEIVFLKDSVQLHWHGAKFIIVGCYFYETRADTFLEREKKRNPNSFLFYRTVVFSSFLFVWFCSCLLVPFPLTRQDESVLEMGSF